MLWWKLQNDWASQTRASMFASSRVSHVLSLLFKDDVLALKNEISRMKAELKRTTEERDILNKAAAYFARVSE